MESFWPLSKQLYKAILEDRVTDTFVCKLIWERLDYQIKESNSKTLLPGANTPAYWYERFPEAPQVISQRSASVHLTRSIPKEYKQSLKNYLNFKGYSINELFPRRTRRATAVNWLLAWSLTNSKEFLEDGPLPQLNTIPLDPVKGHPGDPEIE